MEKDYIYIVYTLINWDINWDITVWDIMIIKVIDSDRVDEKNNIYHGNPKRSWVFQVPFFHQKKLETLPSVLKDGEIPELNGSSEPCIRCT